MGKSCFVPRCSTGYKSCCDKFSLFSAPKDEEQLHVWRRAIPRKDRLLQATDYVCERHFEPHLVSKTWTAEHNGHVLVSTPRRALLAKDAVPTRFPDCPAYLSKTLKSRKRPAERQLLVPSKKKNSPSCASSSCDNSDEVQDLCMPSVLVRGDGCTNATEVQEEAGPSAAVAPSAFDMLFDDPSLVCLASKSWGYHRIEMGEAKSIVFLELTRTRTPQNRSSKSALAVSVRSTSEACPPESIGAGGLFAAPRLVEIDETMEVRTVLMGRSVSIEKLQHSNSLATVGDVKSFLQYVQNIKLCAGGPSTAVYPQAEPKSAFIDISSKRRHKECEFFLSGEVSVCQKCLSVSHFADPPNTGTEKKEQLKSRWYSLFAFPAKQ